MNKLLTIPYSSKLPDALQISSKQFEQEAVMAMAVKLFELKKLSSGMAASLVGVDRVSFLLSLHRYGVDMIDIEPEEITDDLKNA
jgi:predicted HTH domain antitoxin